MPEVDELEMRAGGGMAIAVDMVLRYGPPPPDGTDPVADEATRVR